MLVLADYIMQAVVLITITANYTFIVYTLDVYDTINGNPSTSQMRYCLGAYYLQIHRGASESHMKPHTCKGLNIQYPVLNLTPIVINMVSLVASYYSAIVLDQQSMENPA